MLLAEPARTARLEQIIKELQRYRFGRQAETLPEDQLLLSLEDCRADRGEPQCGDRYSGYGRAIQPSHQTSQEQRVATVTSPRVEMDIDDHDCPCCHNAQHRSGEDVGERLDIVPPVPGSGRALAEVCLPGLRDHGAGWRGDRLLQTRKSHRTPPL